jgi:hypothetical protein
MLVGDLMLVFATLTGALTFSPVPARQHEAPVAEALDSHAQAAAAAKAQEERLERRERAAKRALDSICMGCSGVDATRPGAAARDRRRKAPSRPAP